MIQPAIALPRVVEIEKPVARAFQPAGIVREMQAWQIRIGPHDRYLRTFLHMAIDRVVGVRSVVVIAEGDQRPYLKGALAVREVAGEFVLDHHGVLAVNQEHGLCDLDSGHTIGEPGERMRAEGDQIAIPLRVHRAGILVGAQLEAHSVHDQRIFELGEQHQPADGRLGGCNQQSVVAPGVESDDGG